MKILFFWKPVIWLLIICYLSLIPGEELPSVVLFNIPHFDKIVHMGFYFILSILLINPFSKIFPFPYLASFFISAFISGIIELLQAQYTVSRHGDWVDFIANLTGIFLALVLFRLFISGKKYERFF